jgi:hypothetical protein
MSRRQQEIGVAAILLLALCGCAEGGGDVSAIESTIDQPLHPCRIAGIEEQLLCGKVTVFENRQARSGRMIALNVVVMPAVDPSGEHAPLFHLDGGPGVAATNAAHFYAAFGQGYREDRDIPATWILRRRLHGVTPSPATCRQAGTWSFAITHTCRTG